MMPKEAGTTVSVTLEAFLAKDYCLKRAEE